MSVTTFDTLKYSNTLKAAGVPERQAEAEALALYDILSVNIKDLVTKEDLKIELGLLRSELKSEMALLRTDVKNDIREGENKLKSEMALLRTDVKNDIREGELRSDSKLEKFMVKTAGDLLLVKWMLGVVVTVAIGVVARAAFYSIK